MSVLVAIIATFLVTLLGVVLVQNVTSGEREIHHEVEPEIGVDDPQFERSMSHLLGPPLVDGNRVVSLQNGDQIFPAMLDAVRSAKKTIVMETFIYWSGRIAREFAETLAERARGGVRVHVLLDWFGSQKMDDELIDLMESAGVEVKKYRPLRWYSIPHMNHRTHRKLLVVDGKIAFTGGVGIADEWEGDAENSDNWRDSHFRITGKVVSQLQSAALDNWMKTHTEVLHSEDYFPPLEADGSCLAQVFKSSSREGANSMRLMFLMSIAAAGTRILIASAYFVPDDHAVDALVAARKRGVQIEVIVPGPIIDTHVTRRASRARWGRLLENDIAIYEFQPTMYHCKVMVVDDRWVTVGSANFDNRSFRLNDEANLNVLDRDFAAEQAQVFESDKNRSRQITLEEWRNRPWREKLIEQLASLLGSQV